MLIRIIGLNNFYGLQLLAMRSVVESGEVLIRLRREPRRKIVDREGVEREVPPISLQLLESDFIATDQQLNKKLDNGGAIIQGIEVDGQGRVVAYHLYQWHPGSADTFGFQKSLLDTVRVPAEEILHLYRMDRPGQLRGVPWLSPVMLRLRDFDLFEDAQLKRQQTAAMFTGFIHDLQGLDEPLSETDECEIGEKLEPGIMEILPPGKDIKFSSPPGAENYGEYTSAVLHAIATGLGITFESLTGDLSQVNFSSARMGWLEMSRNIDTWRNNVMIQKMLVPAFAWFKAAAELIGQSTTGARAAFTPPRREMIDPTKEVPALKDAVRAGFKTLSEAVRESGYDPDTHFAEMQSDKEMLDELGLVLDTDPSQDAKRQPQQSTGTPPQDAIGDNPPDEQPSE